MKIQRQALINELSQIVEKAITSAQGFKNLSPEQLNFKEDANSWSILECLEHLNLYGDFYLPEIETQILKTPSTTANAEVFKSGWLGNYFANSMRPKADGSVNKMKTFKDKDPAASNLPISTIDRFIKQQESLLNYLKQAQKLDLTKLKTGITLTKWIKLRLGDTLRFVVYHIERHMLQAGRVEVKVPVAVEGN